MPTFIARRGDGSFLSVGRRGGFKWVSSKSAATRFPVGPTAGRREVREVEDKLVADGVEFSYEELRERSAFTPDVKSDEAKEKHDCLSELERTAGSGNG